MIDPQPGRDPRHRQFARLIDGGAWPDIQRLLTDLRTGPQGIRQQERAADYLRTDGTYDAYLAELAVLRDHAKEQGDVVLMLRCVIIASLICDGHRDRGEAGRLDANGASDQERIERALDHAVRLVRTDDPDRRAPAVLRAALTTSRTVSEPLVSAIRELVTSINEWDAARILAALSARVETPMRETLEADIDAEIAELLVWLEPCWFCDRGWREPHRDLCHNQDVLPTEPTEPPGRSDRATALDRRVAARDPDRWTEAVKVVARHLTASERSLAIKIAADLNSPTHQVAAVQAITPQLSIREASEALTVVSAYPNVGVRLIATLALAMRLPQAQSMKLVADVRSHLSQTPDPWLRAQARRMLARTAGEDQIDEFRRSLADIRSIEDIEERLAALGVAVPELPTSMLGDVVAMASKDLRAGGWRFPFEEIGFAFEAHGHDLDRESHRELLGAAIEGLGQLGSTDLITGLLSLGPCLGSYLEGPGIDELEATLRDLVRTRW